MAFLVDGFYRHIGIVGGYFWSLGAWPVFGFFGLDVALYGAFRLNYRYGKRYETLSMAEEKLVFSQVTALGTARQWEFDPIGCVDIERFGAQGEDIGALILSSHGKYVSVGAFLAPEERAWPPACRQLWAVGATVCQRNRLWPKRAKTVYPIPRRPHPFGKYKARRYRY